MAVGFVASATSGSQASVASFNIGTLGTGARAGIVFVATHNSATAVDTGVTWNGVSMTLLFSATDTNTEPGVVRAYFLDNVANGTITVSRTNNATVCVGYAASISAAGPTFVPHVKTIGGGGTVQTDANASEAGTAASDEVAVDDGSPGTNSMRFAAAFSGAATPPLQGTNSTNLQVLDSTAFGSRFVRETTAGQGSRSVGFATGTTDDWALVAVAVSEVPNPAGTGAITVPSATVAGSGTEVFTATGAISVPSATVAGTGAEVFTATGAVSVPAATVAGSGDHTEANPSGTGAISIPAATVSGVGELLLTGTGAIAVPAAAVAGSGAEIFTATSAVVIPSITIAGDGGHVPNPAGTGAISVPAATVSGAALHIEAVTGTGAIGAPAATVNGTGTGGLTVGETGNGGIPPRFKRRRMVVRPPVVRVEVDDADDLFTLFL